MSLKPAASNDEILEFCNKVREAGGGAPLEALLPGIPQIADSCLIARNLNFECLVGGEIGVGVTDADVRVLARANKQKLWLMSLTDRDTRDKIAAALDLKKVDTVQDADDRYYAVILPRKIGNVASNFDVANNEFYSDYECALENAQDNGLSKKEAHAQAWEVASAGLTEAMKRYAKLTKVVEQL